MWSKEKRWSLPQKMVSGERLAFWMELDAIASDPELSMRDKENELGKKLAQAYRANKCLVMPYTNMRGMVLVIQEDNMILAYTTVDKANMDGKLAADDNGHFGIAAMELRDIVTIMKTLRIKKLRFNRGSDDICVSMRSITR